MSSEMRDRVARIIRDECQPGMSTDAPPIAEATDRVLALVGERERELEAALRKALGILREIEWVEQDDGEYACPWCGGRVRHDDGCCVAEALAARRLLSSAPTPETPERETAPVHTNAAGVSYVRAADVLRSPRGKAEIAKSPPRPHDRRGAR